MALPAIEKNKKLKATPLGKPMAAQVALKKLRARGKIRLVIESDTGPQIPVGGIKKHLQGIAIRGTRVFLTTSVRGGKIITARATPDRQHFIVKSEPVVFDMKVHPGGIQIIGHYIVIPVYGKQYTGIEIRDINDGLSVVKRFNTHRKPFCVGVATTNDGAGEFYVLAVVTDSKGRRVDVYRTPSNLLLKDPACFFELRWTYRASPNVKDPKKDWNGYPNNISLLSDTGGNVYFLGLYKTALIGGKDFADLYHMDFGQPESKMFRRLSRFHARCNPGPAFRWGASASVVGSAALEIYACEKDVQNKTTIRTDLFTQ